MRWITLFSAIFGCAVSSLNPESGKSVPQIIARWNYPVESHKVTTSDGYILTMHRIPYGRRSGPRGNTTRPVVFLQHGFMGNSNNFITNLPHLSPGYVLADAGFDVWMGNFRGNNYCRNHTRLNVNSRQFWNFTWDQMFKFDLTAMIDKVLQTTSQKSLFYVGHSQGAMTMFAKLVTESQFATKIKKFYAWAPVTAAAYVEGFMAFSVRYMYPSFKELYQNGTNEFLPDYGVLKDLKVSFCNNPAWTLVCHQFVLGLAGPSQQQNTSRLDVFLTEFPAGTSMLNAIHSAQLLRTNEFKAYDYDDPTLNTKHYGSVKPPFYDLSTIRNVKIGVYYSDSDFVATARDIQGGLLKQLRPEVVAEKVKLPQFNHMDIVWGYNAPKYLYTPVIEDMRSLLK